MKNTIVIVSIIFVLLGYPYLQIRNLDPEGGCKELKYLPLCAQARWDELFGGVFPWHFETLPADQEMIDNFEKHQDEFESIMKNDSRNRWIEKTKADHLGLFEYINYFSFVPKAEETKQQMMLFWAYELEAASTRYVKGARGTDMSMLLRTKGYVYFTTPPLIKNGVLFHPDHSPSRQFKLVNNLDGPPWPLDWQSGRCWLRQLNERWFLSLCRDQIGG